jgi:hypothetical protein
MESSNQDLKLDTADISELKGVLQIGKQAGPFVLEKFEMKGSACDRPKDPFLNHLTISP